MWQYRKVYARWCVPSPRAPTTAPDAPPLHLYSTSDPADSEYSALIPLLQRQVLCVDTTASTPSTLR